MKYFMCLFAWSIFGVNSTAFAQLTVSPETWQLQKLIETSEAQLKSLETLLKQGQADSAALDQASQILKHISDGIDQSIAPYKGGKAFEEALLATQSRNNFSRTHDDGDRVRKGLVDEPASPDGAHFQQASVQANERDLNLSEKLEQALGQSPPGFVPKIQAQSEISHWRTDIRQSAQLTELLATLHAVREELRALRQGSSQKGPLSSLVIGAEMQNEKLRKARP